MLNKKLFATVVPVLGLAMIAGAQSGSSTSGTQGGTGTQRGGTSGQSGSGQTGSGQTGSGQTGAGQSGSGATAKPGQMGQPGQTGSMADKSGASMSRLNLVQATDVVGMKVTNKQGEQIGKIEDVIIHPRGDIAYAVVSTTEGDKMHAIPWSVLQAHGAAKGADAATGESRSIVLPVDKARLQTAPGFAKGQWPDMKSPDWSREVDQFFAADRASSSAGRPVEASAPRTAGQPIWRASELKGAKVETTTGENLGDVKEVVLDQNGRVSFVVLSVGGFLGMGDRHVAVPFEALKPSMDAADAGKSFTLSTTKDRLKEAPEFKSGRENWSAMSDPTYVSRVYEFYSVRPYWSGSGAGTDDMGGSGAGRGTSGSGGTGGTGGAGGSGNRGGSGGGSGGGTGGTGGGSGGGGSGGGGF